QDYDNGHQSLNSVTCSNGPNGLITKGFTDFASLPSFPYLGASYVVGAWNSPECGSCWQLTNLAGDVTIYVTVIDYVEIGFDVSVAAMNALTNGEASLVSCIYAQATQVSESYCGLPVLV
ncbi:immunomodulatory protein, partial [Lactarius quietus]